MLEIARRQDICCPTYCLPIVIANWFIDLMRFQNIEYLGVIARVQYLAGLNNSCIIYNIDLKYLRIH